MATYSDPGAEAWSAILGCTPSALDRAGVADVLGAIEAVRSVCDSVEVQIVRRARELAEVGACEPPENLLSTKTARSSKESKTATTRERACAAMQPIDAALTSGSMSARHVDVVAAAHDRLDPAVRPEFASHAAELVRRADALGVDSFERECRDLARHLAARHGADSEVAELERQRAASSVKRWIDRSNGMHMTLLGLDPLRDAQVWKAVNAEVARQRQREQGERTPSESFTSIQAASFVAAVTRTATPGRSGPRVPEVSVLIDLDTLLERAPGSRMVCETDAGTALPAATVRRLCCDADVIPIVLGSDGVVLDQGRRFRTATADQRVALAAMYRSCAFPACNVNFADCRIHHIRWWHNGGQTDLANMVPVCERHHHAIHEGGWSLRLTPVRTAIWTRPDGTDHDDHSPLDRRPLDRRPLDVPMLI